MSAPDGVERRTPGGIVFRESLERAGRMASLIPDDKKAVGVIAVQKDGVMVGAAYRSPTGKWEIDALLKAAVVNGKPGDFTFLTTISF